MLFSKPKKKLLMIATGGTIASKNTGEGLAPALTSEELLSCVPEIAQFCTVETVQPFNLDSTDVYYPHWLKIASIIEENYRAFDGFVVTHGTDTMAYTAAALSYLIEGSRKPVVLTGSQKSAYLRDTDARRNLFDAFRFCSDDGAFGVRIVFDGNVILGTRAKKTRTRSYNAFSSVDFPAVAVMRDGEPFYYLRGEKPRGMPVFLHEIPPSLPTSRISMTGSFWRRSARAAFPITATTPSSAPCGNLHRPESPSSSPRRWSGRGARSVPTRWDGASSTVRTSSRRAV